MDEKKLSELSVGECAKISRIALDGSMHRRLLDVGIVCGTEITCVGKSPLEDPRAYLIRGTVVALRKSISQKIFLK